ncbi:MAG: NAD(P)-dependent oxidoreductase [Firmicutes bacterium]|nr:NAD(P)-dependent oxidoreductase [Bacillota bacterium]
MYGMIGLGMMGRAMAGRLAEAGLELVVYNRTTAKAEAFQAKYGSQVRVALSPRAVAEQATVIFSMVADDRAMEGIAFDETTGLIGALGSQHIWVDSSTISPKMSRRLTAAAAERGATRLEAPVSGSVDAAESGRLLMFVGGSAEALDKVRPVVAHLADRVERIGEVGQALSLKLAMNLNIAIQIEGFLEGMMLAERSGLSRETVIEYMLASVIASPMLKYRVPFALNPPAEPWFTNQLMLKDLDLALQQANGEGTALPVTALTADLLRIAIRHGLGNQELAALIPYMADLVNP